VVTVYNHDQTSGFHTSDSIPMISVAQLKSLRELFCSYQLAAVENIHVPKQRDTGPARALLSLRDVNGW
jgi:hypothetical protein